MSIHNFPDFGGTVVSEGFIHIRLFLALSLNGAECSVSQSCPTLCDPMDCGSPGSSIYPRNFPSKNTGVGSHSLLQRFIPTQGSNPCLFHWQADPLPLVPAKKRFICGLELLIQDFCRESPGGTVAGAWHSRCWDPSSVPIRGLRSHKLHNTAKKTDFSR